MKLWRKLAVMGRYDSNHLFPAYLGEWDWRHRLITPRSRPGIVLNGGGARTAGNQTDSLVKYGGQPDDVSSVKKVYSGKERQSREYS